jgi:hypothetical protein
VSGPGIPTRLAALIALRIAQPIRLGIEQCVQRLLTVPRTTRSRWLLIRTSSIVMTLFSGLGVSSDIPSCWPGCVSHLQFSQIRGRQPYLIVRKILYVIPQVRSRQMRQTGARCKCHRPAHGLVLSASSRAAGSIC